MKTWTTGFARSAAVVAVFSPVCAVWAGAAGLVWWWFANPWTWIAVAVIAFPVLVAVSRPVARWARALIAGWTGEAMPDARREPPPVVRMSTGFWWNGYGYHDSERDALMDRRMRMRWSDPATWRDLLFAVVAPLTVGLVAAVPPAGVVVAAVAFALGAPVVGAVALVVAVLSAPFAWRAVPPVAVPLLRPSPAAALAERVEELTAQRADATVAQAAEIRRIERDLHDGAQARLVALGISLATVEKLMATDPGRAMEVLREARKGAATSLSELRELVRGVNPPVLSERGLVDAVRALALERPLEVVVRAADIARPETPVESALYFGVAELLTNAAKHGRADKVVITIERTGKDVVVTVSDDGRGGAEVRPGGGLDGLRRRLAVFDGVLEITGPSSARMAVPCGS
ncbi:histidine kinase [Actinorhabdospora filicis]|uniref:histidine kinase n=1 Tax=Actinorhabdospora filicis TaxID=1785913 RepID=A0A9W6W888_9ACTN|nr:histidine kinase [Actinorhabdospora filicis]GLZ75410.1 histidine kinase [Actinorhabdospora filicis]